MDVEITIRHNNKIYLPVVQEGISVQTERKSTPGTLSFSIVKMPEIEYSEGDAVKMSVDGKGVFYGFIFTQKRSKDGIISITAYDQLRYLKNKDTYVYGNKTVSELIKIIAADYKLNVGAIDPAEYIIPSRVEDNSTLIDIIQNALDLEIQNKKNMFILYDNCGKLMLRSLASMKVPIVIDATTGENFDYTTSIDSNTYNRIKLTRENEKSGKRDVYIAQDSSHINAWGVLQYCEMLQNNENGKAKADALLSLYNARTRNLKITNAFGDIRVRGGSMVVVMLNLGDITVKNYMLVESCKHTFSNCFHTMDLTLRGGEFVA